MTYRFAPDPVGASSGSRLTAIVQTEFFANTGVVCGVLPFVPPLHSTDRQSRRAATEVRFRAGRRLTAEVLAQLGAGRCDVAQNADRSPAWPRGFIGSISHSDGFVYAAAARRADVRGVGIDVESVMSPQAAGEIASLCFNAAEASLMQRADALPRPTLTACFSAKEALFKCLYPIARRMFDFTDAEVVGFDSAAGSFSLRLLTDLSDEFRAGLTFRGKHLWAGEQVFTAVILLPTADSRCR